MTILDEYNEMDGMDKDDIPILDVKEYFCVGDFEEDIKDYNIKPEWVVIDNIIFKRKSEEEMKRLQQQKQNNQSKIVRKR